MSEWDFLWGLKGKELEDAMSSGMSKADRDYLETLDQLTRREKWEDLKKLRDTGVITQEEFKSRKKALFPDTKQK